MLSSFKSSPSVVTMSSKLFSILSIFSFRDKPLSITGVSTPTEIKCSCTFCPRPGSVFVLSKAI